jgi:hypothetical protein
VDGGGRAKSDGGMVFDAACDIIAGMTATIVVFHVAIQNAKEMWPKNKGTSTTDLEMVVSKAELSA